MNTLTLGFMGSSEVSLAALKILLALPEVELSTVWTNPPKPFGRKRLLRPTPVAEYIATLNSKTAPAVVTAEKIGETEIAALKNHPPDAIIVAAFGQILPATWLEVPPLGCYNLHFSLLPKYRGASPIQSAILNGEHKTGITLQKVVFKLDAGDVVLSDSFALLKTKNSKNSAEPTNIPLALSATEAFEKSLELSKELLPKLIDILKHAKMNGTPVPATPQRELKDEDGKILTPSYCHKFSKTNGLLPKHYRSPVNADSSDNADFTNNADNTDNATTSTESAIEIYRRYLALDPWPGLYFIHEAVSYTITGLTPIVKTTEDTLVDTVENTVVDAVLPPLPNLQEEGIYLFSDPTRKSMFLWANKKKKHSEKHSEKHNGKHKNENAQELLEITSIKKAGKNVLSTKDFLNGCRWEFPLKLS